MQFYVKFNKRAAGEDICSPQARGDARYGSSAAVVCFSDPYRSSPPLLSDHLLRHLTTFMIDFLIFINFLKLCVAFFFELQDLLLHVLFHRLDVYSPAF